MEEKWKGKETSKEGMVRGMNYERREIRQRQKSGRRVETRKIGNMGEEMGKEREENKNKSMERRERKEQYFPL